MLRDEGRSPESIRTVLGEALRANYETRYQYARLLKLLKERIIPGVWKLEVADKTIDEIWDKQEYTYKVTNFNGNRICDFSIILHNSTVKGNAAGEMILQDNLVLPPGWKAQIGGNVILFETNDPGACIGKGASREFTFRVWWKNYNPLGAVTASASILDGKGGHRILPGSEIGEFYGPVAVSLNPGTPPEGSRIVLTGQVVADQPAMVTALLPGGAVLSGVVLDVNGQRLTTDENGRAGFLVPAGVAALTVGFGLVSGGGPLAVSKVIPAGPPSAGAPQITAVAPYATPASEVAIQGSAFAPAPGQTTVHLGEREIPVLAVSPVEVIASIPPDAPLGDAGPIVVTTPSGKSNRARIRVLALRLRSNSTSLLRGQRGKAQVIVEGVTDRVAVRIRNLSPQTIRLKGGDSQVKTSSGGRENAIPLDFQSVSSGSFQIEAALATAPTSVSVTR